MVLKVSVHPLLAVLLWTCGSTLHHSKEHVMEDAAFLWGLGSRETHKGARVPIALSRHVPKTRLPLARPYLLPVPAPPKSASNWEPSLEYIDLSETLKPWQQV
jgi:hypothetical protein